MQLVLNGTVQLGHLLFWRIDNLDEERVGLDILNNPFALVREKHDAEMVCNTINASLMDPST